MKHDLSPGVAVTRRAVLAWAGVGVIDPIRAAHAAVPTDTLTVLYRRDSNDARTRQDPAAQAATLALEDEFAKRGFRVVQPAAQVYEMLDKGPAVAVTFAPDAGFSMLFSVFRVLRPMPGVDTAVAEVILRCRVFVGHSVLVAEEGRGMMATSTEASVREFAERRSAEQAAQRAASALAAKVASRLQALSPAEIERLATPTLPPAPTFQPIQLPSELAAPQPAAAAQAPAASAPQPSTTALPPPARKFALIVGVSDYAAVRQRPGMGGMGSLPGVAIDRSNLASALRALGFPADQITVLADAQATSANVREHLGKLVAATRSEDLVMICISAHGAPSNFAPAGFGMPVLSDFSNDNRNALDFWQLQSLVRNLPAQRTVLVLDTCHAGGATGMLNVVMSTKGISVQQGPIAPQPQQMALAQSGDSRAFAVIASSRPEEVSLDHPAEGGLFTSRLVQALKATRGELSLERLFHEQVQPQVVGESLKRCPQSGCKVQTPMFGFSGRGNQIRIS